MIAADFSDARPDPSALAAAGVVRAFVYLGRSRPTAQECAAYRAVGVGMGWIFESAATRAFDGFAAGQQDGAWSATRLDLALPDDPLAVVLGDTPNISGYEADVAAYAHGFQLGLGFTPELGYGCRDAQVVCEPYVLAWWGVETWIAGSTSTSQPDHTAKNVALWDGVGAAMVQAFGPGPAPGTDLDVVLDPAAIGVGPRYQEDEMYVMRCAETGYDYYVSELRVAGYPTAECVRPPDVNATKADVDAEIGARALLVTDLSPKAGPGPDPAPPVDLGPIREGLQAAKTGAEAVSAGLAQAIAALP